MTDAEPAAPTERFTRLYDAHHRRVYAYAVSRAGRQLADEVVSETFLVAWRRLADIPAAELPWLLGVARNVLRDQFRADTRRRSLDAELRSWAEAVGTHAGDVADDVADRAEILNALTSLSEDDRELLTLVAWDGLTSREAARVVGCSAATYSVRLHRARRRLERAMSGTARGTPAAAPPPVHTSVVPGKESS